MKTNPTCRKCDVELNDENWYPSLQKINSHICKSCNDKSVTQWRKANPEKARVIQIRHDRKRGERPMGENKECAAYLGVYVAEGILSQAFKNVQRMPYGNPGYDFKCSNGFLIDVKSACKGKTQNGWRFRIDHNVVADYFLCLAFDNRENLNPLHVWLIPGAKLNHLKGTSIAPSTIHKWDAYRLDITKVMMCCDAMRS